MKIVVLGGTGLIGSKVISHLRDHGHDAVAASPSTGVNAVTGEGLADALSGASTVIDVSDSPSFEDGAVQTFFETSTRNLLDREREAGVAHHVALSVVGVDRLGAESGYFRAKMIQEALIEGSGIPYSIVAATQFFEFLAILAEFSTVEDVVRLPPIMIQPIAAGDVAHTVAMVSVGQPINGRLEVAGPETYSIDVLVRTTLDATRDGRQVVTDPQASYAGVTATERLLLPGAGVVRGPTRVQDWMLQRDEPN